MKNSKKNGFSLIEIMVAIVVLIVLVLGAASLTYQLGGGIQRQQNKREAVVVANHVAEAFWNMSYDTLKTDYAGTADKRTVTVNGVSRRVTVTVGDEQTDSWGDSYMEFTVDLDHRSSTDDIVFTIRRYPAGLSRAIL